jgi:hypothetical protein
MRRLDHCVTDPTLLRLDEVVPGVEPLHFVKRLLRDIWPDYASGIINLEQIDPRETKPLLATVDGERAASAVDLIKSLEKRGIAAYETVVSRSSHDGPARLVIPPVLEIHDQTWVIIDGIHRIWAAQTSHLASVRVVAVRNVSVPLPMPQVDWEYVKLGRGSGDLSEILGPYDPDLFRPLAPAFSKLVFDNLDELAGYVRKLDQDAA